MIFYPPHMYNKYNQKCCKINIFAIQDLLTTEQVKIAFNLRLEIDETMISIKIYTVTVDQRNIFKKLSRKLIQL